MFCYVWGGYGGPTNETSHLSACYPAIPFTTKYTLILSILNNPLPREMFALKYTPIYSNEVYICFYQSGCDLGGSEYEKRIETPPVCWLPAMLCTEATYGIRSTSVRVNSVAEPWNQREGSVSLSLDQRHRTPETSWRSVTDGTVGMVVTVGTSGRRDVGWWKWQVFDTCGCMRLSKSVMAPVMYGISPLMYGIYLGLHRLYIH